MSFGVTATGFVKKTTLEILADVEAQQRDTISPVLDTDPERPLGQINGIIAGVAAELWEKLEQVYSSLDPDAAEDAALDNVASLTGTIRESATASLVTCTLGLDAGITVPAGSRVSLDGDDTIQFELLENVTSFGAGNYFGDFQCTETGPVVAPAGTLTNIVTPVVGWNTCTNADDADVGSEVESNPALRARREIELRATGLATVGAIQAKVLGSDEAIEDVIVLENTTGTTVDGIPAHGIEVVIFDGDPSAVDDDIIAQAIFDSKSAGTPTTGDESGTALDPLGDEVTVSFSRAEIVDIEFQATVIVSDLSVFPGDDAVEEAIANFAAENLPAGKDFITLIYAAIVQNTAGVERLTSYGARVEGVGSFDVADIEITRRQKARLQLANVSITVA